MPDKAFLENYSLYRKFRIEKFPSTLDQVPVASINMHCSICASSQTFIMTNKYWENYAGVQNHPTCDVAFRLLYRCTHCNRFDRFFYVKTGNDENAPWYMKIGQYPAWDITGEPNIERYLGDHADYYKKGQICESQGYGIAAFAYYRRIVELTIDELLKEIAELLSGDELEEYDLALEKTKKATVASEKIDLVKDLLPAILRPDGMNPLSALHSALSQGLHSKSDEDCLELAEYCREPLVFLVKQVAASKQAAKSFTSSMRKLLDKKSESSS